MMKFTGQLLLVMLLLLGCKDSQDFIFPEDGIIDNAEGTLSPLKAVGKYQGSSSCTAVYVKTTDNPNSPAYVLTNGHCVQDWDPNKIYNNLQAPNHYVTFNMFKSTPVNEQVKIGVKQIVYSTMKGTDLAIVELNTTVAGLSAKGIQPIMIAKSIPAEGTEIKVFGIPVSGLDYAEQFLRQSSCNLGQKTDLIEFTWTWWDMYSNACGNIRGGSSGSPVLSSFDKGVFGLINTTTIGAESPCYLGGPCESTQQGVNIKENTSYTLSIVGVDACFNSNGVFDLALPKCMLEKGVNNANIFGSPLGSINPSAQEINAPKPSKKWDYTVENVRFYKYKIGKVGSSNPRDISGYSPVIVATEKSKISEDLPSEPGHYYLSVIGGNTATYDASWQQVNNPTLARIEIDVTPPTKDAEFLYNETEDGYSISLGFSPPELSNYVFKIGHPDDTDENNPKGYYTYRRVPIDIYYEDLPVKICVIGYDNAGNPTKTYVKILNK